MQNVERLPSTQVVEKNGKVSLLTRASIAAGSLLAVGAANAAEGDVLDLSWVDTVVNGLKAGAAALNSIYGVAILVIAAMVVFGLLKGGTKKVG